MFNAIQTTMQGETQTSFSPEHQGDWSDIVENCGLSINAICEDFKFDRQSFVKWLDCKRTPRPKNQERMIKAMTKVLNEKKLIKHPSYGYATQEQIDKLKEIGVGLERDYILKQIEKQTKLNGKKR